jgi:hypothetical protein
MTNAATEERPHHTWLSTYPFFEYRLSFKNTLGYSAAVVNTAIGSNVIFQLPLGRSA